MIKISVLIPIYGVEKYIERCARSLFEQTMKEGIEYIFVDDCTKDKSVEILENVIEKYPDRKTFVKIIHHKMNKGLAGARNTGIDNASGDYICFVDSDDYIDVFMLEKLYEKAIDTNADIVTCNYLWQFPYFSTKNIIKKREGKKEYLLDILTRTSPHMLCSRIFRRTLFENHQIRVPVDINMGEDLATTPRLFYFANTVAFIDDHLYFYWQANSSSYTRSVNQKSVDSIIAAFDLLYGFFADKDIVYQNAIEYNKFLTSVLFLSLSKGSVQLNVFKMISEKDVKKYKMRLSPYLRLIYDLSSNNMFSVLNLMLTIRYWLGCGKRFVKSWQCLRK